MYSLKNAVHMIWNVIQSMTFMDIIDILLMTYIVYLVIKLVKETRAGQLIKGILIIVAAYIFSNYIGFKAISYIIKSVLDIGLLALLIMFQPEIRRALEKAGNTKLGSGILSLGDSAKGASEKWNAAIEAICDSCMDLSSTKTGALIVIERKTKLGEQIENGTMINATPSKELLGSIFFPNTPLHDGAVIMRDGIVLAAACFLPKPQKEELINKKLGSRHRAAIGMSENSDAIVIVVSEETGQISIAENGVLVRDYTRFKLNEHLREALIPKESEQPKKKSGKKAKEKGADSK